MFMQSKNYTADDGSTTHNSNTHNYHQSW